MSKFKVTVAFQEFRRFQASFELDAETSKDAWLKAFKLNNEHFNNLEFINTDHEPSDYEIVEVEQIED